MVTIEGRRPVLEALRSGQVPRRLLLAAGSRGETIDRICDEARRRGVPVEWIDRRRLDALAPGRRHQGVLAEIQEWCYWDLPEVMVRVREREEEALLLVCAEIQDPQNLGALIRTAEAAGFHGAVIPKHRSAPVSAAVLRASAGAAAHLPVARVTNLTQALEFLKKEGLWVCAASADAASLYFEVDLSGPLAVVVGSEGRGIPRRVYQHCDLAVRIPMQGQVGSLNASVAGALLMYEAVRQRWLRARR